MIRLSIFICCCCCVLLKLPLKAFSEPDSTLFQTKKMYTTERITGVGPIIDGNLDDLCWQAVDWGKDFIQLSPSEGEAPSQKTWFKILYDDRNLYVAFRCLDTDPEKL